MDAQEILKFFLRKGLLVDKEVLNLFTETEDIETAKLIIEKIGARTQKRIITKTLFEKNIDKISEIILDLPKETQKTVEKLKIKLGLSIQISKEILIESIKASEVKKPVIPAVEEEVKITSMFPSLGKKIEVGDFVRYFRNRVSSMMGFLQERTDLNNLVSINKISGDKQGISIIGLVSDKRVTKNKNILLDVEDLTGKIRILINHNKPELYEKAEDITLDSVLGFKCSGNREILFANDIIFPDLGLVERKNSPVEEYALFIGDLHFGSKRFLEEGFLRFIDYISGKIPNTPEVEKIKYLFIVGDVVTGVGNYPNQEGDLKLLDLEEQFSEITQLLEKIPKSIQIIISPGNHDGVRIMEPQPILNERYAWALYNMKNVILTSNPAHLTIGAKKGFSGFNVLTYHGFSFPYYANNISSLVMKRAMDCPEEISKYLLKNRHLAPTHSSIQYFPLEEDALMIKKAPDIFVSAHTHKSAVSYYNNILIISTSCWEGMTPYQEKFGNTPDHCKVPMLNLKTRAVKILDFE